MLARYRLVLTIIAVLFSLAWVTVDGDEDGLILQGPRVSIGAPLGEFDTGPEGYLQLLTGEFYTEASSLARIQSAGNADVAAWNDVRLYGGRRVVLTWGTPICFDDGDDGEDVTCCRGVAGAWSCWTP